MLQLMAMAALALTVQAPRTLASNVTPAPPRYVVLIRHAEKPNDAHDPHLSREGVRRAERLVTFMRDDPAMKRLGRPAAIFATKTTKDDDGQRTQETVAPLAAALGLRVQTPFTGAKYDELAQRILSTPEYAGKTVVICWNHEELPDLAGALGVMPRPTKWKAAVFDEIYILSFQGKAPTLTVTRYP